MILILGVKYLLTSLEYTDDSVIGAILFLELSLLPQKVFKNVQMI